VLTESSHRYASSAQRFHGLPSDDVEVHVPVVGSTVLKRWPVRPRNDGTTPPSGLSSPAGLRESSAPLVGHEERTDATDQADDSDGPEHGGAYELETAETCHHQEDDARDEEPETNEVDSHSLLRLGGAARRNVPQLGDWTDVPGALPLVLSLLSALLGPIPVAAASERAHLLRGA
jgi:hypothetical protein